MSEQGTYYIHEGQYAAEIGIATHEDGSPWGPVVDKDDVFKADRVRLALRRGDLGAAAKEAKVFEMLPLAGE
jgi:hypothetical protein